MMNLALGLVSLLIVTGRAAEKGAPKGAPATAKSPTAITAAVAPIRAGAAPAAAPASGAAVPLSAVALPSSVVPVAEAAERPVAAEAASGEEDGAAEIARLAAMFDHTPEYQQLEAELAKPGRMGVSPLGLKTAKFDSLSFKPQYEPMLKRMGVHVVTIDAPSRRDLATLTEDKGYFLRPGTVEWIMPARTRDEYVNMWTGKDRGTFKNQLKQSDKFIEAGGTIETVPLNAADYAAWHKIFKHAVVSREGGVEAWTGDFGRRMESGDLDEDYKKMEVGTIDQWSMIKFKATPDQLRQLVAENRVAPEELAEWEKAGIVDMKSDKPFMVGAMLVHDRKADRGNVAIRAAAILEPFKRKSYLALRGVVEAMDIARKAGLDTFSYGTDMPLYGDIQALGLLNFKSSLGLRGRPQRGFSFPKGVVELIKVLKPGPLATVVRGGKRQGYALWTLKRDGPFIENYLAAREAGRVESPSQWFGDDGKTPAAQRGTDVWRGIEHFPADEGVTVTVPDGVKLNPRLP
jgi:hypothetical protein